MAFFNSLVACNVHEQKEERLLHASAEEVGIDTMVCVVCGLRKCIRTACITVIALCACFAFFAHVWAWGVLLSVCMCEGSVGG